MFGSPFRHSDFRLLRAGALVLGISGAALGAATSASANPAIVVDAATGDVLYAEQATEAWYPASLTKLMTFYVALNAVRDHKITLDTPIVISLRASAAAPSKMGFKPGTEVTLGNALKMMIVKSANDIAIAVAEAVSGSVEAFAEDMNATAAQLGMRESHFVNPNGLPDPEHFSSARDLAVLARAIYVDYPQEAAIFSIGALRLGDEIIPTHNTLLGRYPGVDGMKTGFTCAAGFNLVASAERNDHRYIAVVLGAPSVELRMLKTAVLLDRAFDGIDHPIDKLDAMQGIGTGTPPDMHNEICRRRAKASLSFQTELNQLEAPLLAQQASPAAPVLGLITGNSMAPVAPTIASEPKPVFDPVLVTLGPEAGYTGAIAQARPPHSPVGTPGPQPVPLATDTQQQPQNAANTDQNTEDTEEAPKPEKKEKTEKTKTAKAHQHKPATKEAAAKPKPLHHIAKAKPKTEKTDTASGDTTEPDSKATDTAEKKEKSKHHAQKKMPAVKVAKKLAKKHLARDTGAPQTNSNTDAAKPAAPAAQ